MSDVVNDVSAGSTYQTAALAANQLIADTTNPPVVPVPNLASIVVTGCRVGDIIWLTCNGAIATTVVSAPAGAFKARFDVDGVPIGADACNKSSFTDPRDKTALSVNFRQFFVATAQTHTFRLVACSLIAQYVAYAGFRIGAINFGHSY